MLTLRDYKITDIDRLADLANNENVSRFLGPTFPYPYTRQDAEWWITAGSKMNHAATKAIEYNGELVGGIGLHPQSGCKRHSAEIGYWLGEQYWGQGLATGGLVMMTEFAFSKMGFKKVFAPVLGPNETSMRVLEKCGYRLEGVLEFEVYKAGQYFDVYHYAKYCR